MSEREPIKTHERTLERQRLKMMATVSHDMKAPLQRVLGLARLLGYSQEGMTEEQIEYVERITYIAFDGISMVNNMIDGYKMGQHEVQREIKPILISKIILDQITYHSEASKKKNVIIIYTGDNNAAVVSDEGFIFRIVGVLLSNAIKFSPTNYKIDVVGAVVENSFVLSVRDYGPGMTEEDQKLLFHQFQRLSARPTAGESSTGLGLFLVKILIDQLKGTIKCESTLGKGSTFIVTIPHNAFASQQEDT